MNRIQDAPRITIHPAAWEPTGPDGDVGEAFNDPRARLLAVLYINGIAFHVEAYAVLGTYVPGEEQRIACSYFDSEWTALCTLEPEEAMATQEIEGREYVIVAFPMSA